jgi:hypothetical protein
MIGSAGIIFMNTANNCANCSGGDPTWWYLLEIVGAIGVMGQLIINMLDDDEEV